MCSVVVESWYEKQQYTCCLVVKRRTAAARSPATSTIIAALWGCWWESAVSRYTELLLSRGTKSSERCLLESIASLA